MKCVIKSCKSSNYHASNYHETLTFHKIPKDIILRNKWLKAIHRNPQEFSVNSSACCSRHFEPHYYITSLKGSLLHTSTKKLKKGAIPTLFLDLEETSWKEGEEIQVLIQILHFTLNLLVHKYIYFTYLEIKPTPYNNQLL